MVEEVELHLGVRCRWVKWTLVETVFGYKIFGKQHDQIELMPKQNSQTNPKEIKRRQRDCTTDAAADLRLSSHHAGELWSSRHRSTCKR